MARVLSVNVGLPRDVAWRERLVHTGIWKSPVAGPVMARRLNLDGDGQGDLAGHGGEQRAVMVYQAASYDYWARELDRSDLTYGMFGENFTVDGLPDDEVCIGDRYRIGDAEFEVTQPRTTCYRVGMRLGEPRMASLLVAHHRPGFYLRVLREGLVQAGDDIVAIGSGPEQLSIAAVDGLLYLPDADPTTMRRALRVPALSPGWQGSFRDLVDRVDHPRRAEAVPPPAWEGFRRMRVAELVHETALVTSVHLQPVEGGPLPAPRPGQYLTVRVDAAGEPPPVRNYSLSAWTPDSYRISVKRESPGWVSEYVGTALAVGDDLDVAAPRGEFVLDDGDEPVVLLSAGIGVTPVLAMLAALAARRSTRPVWWLHTTSGPTTHVLAAETDRLLRSLPDARSRVFLTSAPAGPTGSGVIHGRIDRAALAALDLPLDASVYLCGPQGFMAAMTVVLAGLGVAPGRIHTEVFASLSAVNPGVVAADRPAPHVPATVGTGPEITFSRAGVSAPFDLDLASLLEMAEACDVPTRWSCRTGVCHTCSTPMLSGKVDYTVPPLTAPEAGQVLLCCTRPATDVVLDL